MEFAVKEVTNTPTYGEFVLEPLETGYGATIGHALRRILYTSISGAAVTSVSIAGVKHRFSTVPGLKENIVDFLMNVKNLHVALPENRDEATLKISVKGNAEITAADVQASDGAEVMNKDLYLGSLSGDKSKFDMELTVQRGNGYSLSEEREVELGVIPTDAIFTPVERVTYTVEATRVGRQTNLDKLTLKIWTNGTVTPKDALDTASRLLAQTFTQIYAPQMSTPSDQPMPSSSPLSDKLMKMTIDELDLPTRIYNSLRNGGIETVEQLVTIPRKELVSMRNMGGKSLEVIEEKLSEKGVSLSL
jgi:DNA-directed RNA polymerase subunit alpha